MELQELVFAQLDFGLALLWLFHAPIIPFLKKNVYFMPYVGSV